MRLDHQSNDEEAADRLMRHRLRTLPVITLIFMAVHLVSARNIARTGSIMDISMLSWTAIMAVLLYILQSGGPYLRGHPGVRAYFDDEVSRANRLRAMAAGFWAAMAAGGAIMLAPMWMPVPALLAAHSIVGIAVLAAIIRYIMLERVAIGPSA